MTDPRQEAALDYVRRGLKVVPLHTPVWSEGEWRCSCGDWPCKHQVGKHPRHGFGKDHPCTDENEVRAAWVQWPDANVGVVVPDGYFVADLDGQEAIAWWDAKAGSVVETRTTLSGSGVGEHRWYQLPAGTRVRNGVWVEFPGVHQQVKVITGGMGYVVAPPSLHSSGGRYGWRNGVRVSAIAPPEIVAVGALQGLNGTHLAESPADMMRQAIGKVAGQQRDTLMLRYLGSLHRFSPGAEALLAAAREMDSVFGETLGEEKLVQHVNTIIAKPGGQALPPMSLGARMTPPGEQSGRPNRLQRIESDPKTWLLHFGDFGYVRLTTVQLQAWGSVQGQWLEQRRGAPPWMPSGGNGADAAPWLGPNGLLQELLDRMTDEDFIQPSPEETLGGRVAALCRRRFRDYLRDESSIQDLRQETGWWHNAEQSRVEFRLAALVVQENAASVRNPMTTANIALGVRTLGGQTGQQRWVPSVGDESGTNVKVAFIPDALLDGSDPF